MNSSSAALTPIEVRLQSFVAAYEKSSLPAAGVAPPSGSHSWALMLLWENIGQPVGQRDIVQFYVDHGLGQYDRQVRQKAAAGWNLASGNIRTQNMEYRSDFASGEIALLSLDPNPRPMANRKRQFSELDWDQKLALFVGVRGGCAMCGTKCHSYDRGHLDRLKPMTIDNIVPICSGCNNYLQARDMDACVDEATLVVRAVAPDSMRIERQRQKKARNSSYSSGLVLA